MRLAALAVEQKKPGDAVKHYQKIATDSSADQIFRDYASLRIASLKVDDENWTETKNRLTEIAKDGRPWAHAARELMGLAAYKAGKYNEARQALAELVGDAKVPPSIGQRAQILLGLITMKQGGSPANSKPASGAGKKSGTATKAKGEGPSGKN